MVAIVNHMKSGMQPVNGHGTKAKQKLAATLAKNTLRSRTWRLSVLIQTKNHPEIQHLNGGSPLAVVSCKGKFLP